MRTLRFLLQSAGPLALLLGPLGFASAGFNAGLMATIHRALTERQLGHDVVLAFIGFGLGRALSGYLSTVLLGNHATKTVTELRRDIIARLPTVPYRLFERVGAGRVHAALTQDLIVLESALSSVPTAVTSAAMLVGGAAYLAYLNPVLFLGCSALVLPCFFVFRLAARHADAAYSLQRAAYDRLYHHFGALTQGMKELKLHAARRLSFLEGPVRETTNTLREQDVASRSRYALASVVNQALVLGMLATVLFLVPQGSALRTQVGSGYVLVGLYLMSPLAALSRMWPTFRAAEFAMQSLQDLGIRLQSAQDEASADPSIQPGVTRIELHSATHRYDDERNFVLGPISLQLVPGEVVFVVGGNGSGKTTLGRLLAGLYEPSSGELLWDGQLVDAQHRDAYRQLWSAVFSDPYLFDRLYGLDPTNLEQRATQLLSKLQLTGIVRVTDGTFSSLEVSQGQRKRLGLFVALLEDRPLYLFDEWAADQDPQWKQTFYRELLPELRARGKGVVVITHDDRYFDAADRLLVLHDGQLDA
ncbi:MAG TPA: cyclic peptide export ABC transporter [Polyangiales bacterium]